MAMKTTTYTSPNGVKTTIKREQGEYEIARDQLLKETGKRNVSPLDVFDRVDQNRLASGKTPEEIAMEAAGGTSTNTNNSYTNENGITYATNNPLGPEEIIKRYTEMINSEPTSGESDRTKAAYERLQSYNDNRPEYSQSDAVTEALERLRNAESARPDAYSSMYQADIDAILDSLNNREGFSYDPGEDQLYKTYRDQYLRLGQRAMQDTIGNAAALGGGYGSSYAQRAGQQAYQDYLAGMNDAVNTMYGQAYQRYQDEGNELYNRLNALQGLENEAYSRYRDQLSDYLTERAYANTNYANERATDYDQYRDQVGDWETDRNYWNSLYNTERANDQTDYANRLAQWQNDRNYWQQLLESMNAYDANQYSSYLDDLLALQAQQQPVVNVQDRIPDLFRTAAGGGKTGTKEGKVKNAVSDLARWILPADVDASTGADPGTRARH